MSAQAPKLYALEALVAQKLSDAGRRRIERHLAGCATCRAALAGVREYAALREAARDLPMPELSWDRLSTALDQQKRSEPVRNGKALALALPMLTIAAAMLIGWIGISQQRNAAELASRTPAIAAPAVPAVPMGAPLTGWVTAGATDARAPGSSVTEGDVLRTDAGQELHVRFSDNTGIVLWENSELALTRLREHEVRLSLQRGGVSSVVQKLGPADSYAVAAGTVSAEVRGTHFFVGHNAEGVRIDVHEGRVAVLREGKQIDLLDAGGSHVTSGLKGDATKDRSVIGLAADSKSSPSLTLPALPQVAAWHVAGVRWSATTGFSMHHPAGEVSLSIEDARGKLHPLKVTVPPGGVAVSEAQVRAAMREMRVGVLAPEDIAPVIEAALPSLQRCYEQSLHLAPNLAGAVTLGVRVAADGHVARTQLRGAAELPSELSACIAKQARAWRFKAPRGGPATFEIGLNLK